MTGGSGPGSSRMEDSLREVGRGPRGGPHHLGRWRLWRALTCATAGGYCGRSCLV